MNILSISSPISEQRIIVGNKRVQEALEPHVRGLGCKLEVHPSIPELHVNRTWRKVSHIQKYGPHFFCRDTQILIDGTFYLPYSTQLEFPNTLVWGLLPPSLGHFIKRKEAVVGCGFEPAYQEVAIQCLDRLSLKYWKGKTCLENGNVILFSGKAIVGEASLYLSLVMLHFSKYFTFDKLLPFITRTPKDEDIHRARNWALAVHKDRCDSWRLHYKEELDQQKISIEEYDNHLREIRKSEDSFFKEHGYDASNFPQLLLSPLTEAQRKRYTSEATVLYAKIQVTKNLICEELGLPPSHVAFILQSNFHIDEDCFAFGNTVFFHSSQVSELALETHFQEAGDLSTRYELEQYHNASQRSAFSREIENENRARISAIGCKVAPIGGFFEAPNCESVCFMNCLVIGNRLLTGNVRNAHLKDIFKRTVSAFNQDLDIQFIDHPSLPLGDMFKGYINLFHGGLRCLTFETPSSFWDQIEEVQHLIPHKALWSIVISYLK